LLERIKEEIKMTKERMDNLIHEYQIRIKGDGLTAQPTGYNKSIPANIIAEIKANKEAIIARITEQNEKQRAEMEAERYKEEHTCSRCKRTGDMVKAGTEYYCKHCHALLTQVGFGERTALEDTQGHRSEPSHKADY